MTPENYKQVCIAESNIAERGYMSMEDLMHLQEFRPWMFKVLSIYLNVWDVREYLVSNKFPSIEYFKMISHYRCTQEPRLSFFHKEVLFE